MRMFILYILINITHILQPITNISYSDTWRMATEKVLLTIPRTVPVQYSGLNADILLQKDTDINLGKYL